MRKARIWVVITDGMSARICSTEDGSVHPLIRHSPEGVIPADSLANREEERSQAWYRMRGQSFSIRRTTSVLAGHLVQVLAEAARERAYDGLVVIAAPGIARELDRALTPETRIRLIGEIVRDLPSVVSTERMAQAELQH